MAFSWSHFSLSPLSFRPKMQTQSSFHSGMSCLVTQTTTCLISLNCRALSSFLPVKPFHRSVKTCFRNIIAVLIALAVSSNGCRRSGPMLDLSHLSSRLGGMRIVAPGARFTLGNGPNNLTTWRLRGTTLGPCTVGSRRALGFLPDS